MIGFWLDNKFHSWNTRIDRLALLMKRSRDFVAKLINVVAVLFGLGMLAIAAYTVVINNRIELLITWNYWLNPSIEMAAFWMFALVMLFLFYRYSEAKRDQARVAKMAYEAQVPEIVNVTEEETKGKGKRNIGSAFGSDAMKAVEDAYKLAEKFKQPVEPLHLFVGALGSTQVSTMFVRLGITFETVKDPVNRKLNSLGTGEVKFSQDSLEALVASYLNAYQHNLKEVSPIELFLEAYKRDEFVQELLFGLDIEREEIENVAAWIRISEEMVRRYKEYSKAALRKPTTGMNRAMTAVATPLLDRISEDLTVAAAYGKLPMLIGREAEMASVLRAIEGGNQSVVLVGPPGVGKDALVFGIAERMVEERVPKVLQDKRLVRISIPHLVSGATPSEAQERLLSVISEVGKSKNIVLAIDGIEQITGISTGGEMSSDLSSILVDAITRRIAFVIATTTPDAYTGAIERSSLGQVLQKVSIDEPEVNEAIQILEGKLGNIEYQNSVVFTYDAVFEAVSLSDRYMHDRFLPAKAIEVCQEVALEVAKTKGKNALVMKEDVAKIISEKTKIPVTQVAEEEKEKLLHLEERMHERMIGQETAVDAVSAALRRARTELRAENRPIANFLFLGPTGVGKTELAKTTAESFFGDEEAMVRFDMSEYQNQDSVNRLIGSAGQGGLLTEAIRSNPFTLLLLDELEKAHPDILNLFLQVMDDGRLTDGAGRTIDFTNVILIATSNAGTEYIQDQVAAGTPLEQIQNHLIEVELKGIYRPEFLNRFDDIIVFKPLGMDEVVQIAYLMIGQVADRLEAKGVHFKATDEAVEELARKGYDPKFGARPLRRVIQDEVDNLVAKALLENKVGRRDTIVLKPGGKIVIEKAAEL